MAARGIVFGKSTVTFNRPVMEGDKIIFVAESVTSQVQIGTIGESTPEKEAKAMAELQAAQIEHDKKYNDYYARKYEATYDNNFITAKVNKLNATPEQQEKLRAELTKQLAEARESLKIAAETAAIATAAASAEPVKKLKM